MALVNSVMEPAFSVSGRKEQLRSIYEGSGMFTFDKEFNSESDIYFINYSPLRKVRADYRLRGMSTLNELTHTNNSRGYIYPISFDDSGTNIPSLSENALMSFITRSTSSTSAPDAVIPLWNSSFAYVYVNNPKSGYLNLNNVVRFIWSESISGIKMWTIFRSSDMYAIDGKQGVMVNTAYLSTSLTPSSTVDYVSRNILGLNQAQYTINHKISLDGVHTHDRLIQNLRPLDYTAPPEGTAPSSISSNYVTSDPLNDLYSFSNTGLTLSGDMIYVDNLTGKEYLYIQDNVMIEIVK